MKYIGEMDIKKCCGCRACEQVCPVGCIKMNYDAEGFIVPIIDVTKCISCGKCVEVCSQKDSDIYNGNNGESEVYAARNNNKATVLKSSSGGVFIAIAEMILSQNGVVVGCAFDENFQAHHILVHDKVDLWKLMGSKYIQSEIGNVYGQIKKILLENRPVLFSGTGCQVASLKKNLGIEYDNLFTIDIICHGVPSQKLFNKYLKYLEIKHNGVVTSYDFRCKDKSGWGHVAKYVINSKEYYETSTLDPFYHAFIQTKIFRECCYSCKYACNNRVGDISLGDYWGIEIVHPEFASDSGNSLVLVNTPKGKKIFSEIKKTLMTVESSYQKAAVKNCNLTKPASRPLDRDRIYKEIDTIGTKDYISNYFSVGISLKARIKKFIPYSIKKKIKKLLKPII